ncbi:putative homeobox-leucine zipper protein HOX11 [Iris pallida]|uniref:Homeobox-leucine zipper protein HOX11 n=1 Tax=Iris pallida TaxID=29817 RepID=A0AAX6DYL0_IRIPA|nr:putative homeobox-leucine zipper protein HOX11 [Iris pallida]
MELGLSLGYGRREEEEEEEEMMEDEEEERSSGEPPVQLSLLPSAPAARFLSSSSHLGFPWPADHSTAAGNGNLEVSTRGFDVNRVPSAEDAEEGSPNSTVSSFRMDFSSIGIVAGGASHAARSEGEAERASSRASDEEENGGMARKKLRLSKEQSAFLEESFKEHNTLNPKQKQALAKQLNLRPRQVEVWFQNRRARTKLKQTEVDCEYLKRCCETLTEENRRLQKELSELRALKTTPHPSLFMQLPATTLSMCPSCERTTTSTAAAAAAGAGPGSKPGSSFASLFGKPRFYPFASSSQSHPATSPAS